MEVESSTFHGPVHVTGVKNQGGSAVGEASPSAPRPARHSGSSVPFEALPLIS